MGIVLKLIGLVAPSLVTQIVMGVLVASLAGGAAWHFVAVNKAYYKGKAVADEKCRVNALAAKQKAELLYQKRAALSTAQLEADRATEAKRAADAQEFSQHLELELQQLKTNPICWTPRVIRELHR